MTGDEVLEELLSTFDTTTVNINENFTISYKIFEEYYTNVSFFIENDGVYETILRDCWKTNVSDNNNKITKYSAGSPKKGWQAHETSR